MQIEIENEICDVSGTKMKSAMEVGMKLKSTMELATEVEEANRMKTVM